MQQAKQVAIFRATYLESIVPQGEFDLIQLVFGDFEVNRIFIYDVRDIFVQNPCRLKKCRDRHFSGVRVDHKVRAKEDQLVGVVNFGTNDNASSAHSHSPCNV